MPMLAFVLAILLAAPSDAGEPDWSGKKAAFFGVAFVDNSHEGALNGSRADETARTEAAGAQIAAAFEERGVDLVDLAPVSEELARTPNPGDCNGCALRMARELGVDLVVLAEVSKTSNLILSLYVVVLDAATGERLRGLSADIRGNTDESWTRGFGYVLKNAIFKA